MKVTIGLIVVAAVAAVPAWRWVARRSNTQVHRINQ